MDTDETEPRSVGRPTIRTPELLAEICAEVADGRSLRSICRRPDMPGMTTVFQWLTDDEQFQKQYAIAMDARIEAHVEDMLEIADDGANDWMATNDPDNPGYRANGENISRSRLRVDTRKWIASKLKPKKYGERLMQEHAGPNGEPLPAASQTVYIIQKDEARQIEKDLGERV